MENLRSKVAYLQGLAQGLDVGTESREGRLLAGILDLLGEMAEELGTLKQKQEDLKEYVEAIDDDLAVVEDEVCPVEDDESYAEIECPACGDTVVLEGDDDVLELTCPSCGESIYREDFELEEDNDRLENDLRGRHIITEEDALPKE